MADAFASITWIDYVGSFGTLLVVIAYFLTQLRIMSATDLAFPLINLVGSLLIGASLYVNFNLASALIEFFWVLISLFGIYQWVRLQKKEQQMAAINLEEKLAKFSDCWSPKIISTYNGNEVMLAKFEGEFTWHSHPDTDDFFLVIEGDVTIEMPDKIVHLGPGEMYVVPKGVEHKPSTKNGASVLLIEPKGTPNSGDVKTAAVKVEI